MLPQNRCRPHAVGGRR